MPRDFTEKDLEEIGWNLVDRMLAISRPQPAQEQPDMGMRLQGLRQSALKWATTGGGRGRRLGIPAMPKLPTIEEANHGNRP